MKTNPLAFRLNRDLASWVDWASPCFSCRAELITLLIHRQLSRQSLLPDSPNPIGDSTVLAVRLSESDLRRVKDAAKDLGRYPSDWVGAVIEEWYLEIANDLNVHYMVTNEPEKYANLLRSEAGI